jgi:hypothetical protein
MKSPLAAVAVVAVAGLCGSWSAGAASAFGPARSGAGATSSSSAVLSGVACVSADHCTAVGWYVNPQNSPALALVWDGGSWTVQPTPEPAGRYGFTLTGVACSSAASCTAVGSAYSSTGSPGPYPLAEHWDGSAWMVQPTPAPAGSVDAELNGVSCPGLDHCVAVGQYRVSSGTVLPLAEAWHASSGWAIQSAPEPTGQVGGGLDGVMCASNTSCTAVGFQYGSDQLTLAEIWNGTSWHVEATPTPPNAAQTGTFLNNDSCTAPTSCVAVGAFAYIRRNGSENTSRLAEAQSGTTWTALLTAAPAHATRSGLYGISCVAADSCLAVGGYSHVVNGVDTDSTLAEAWNGTSWSLESTPNRTSHASLAAVSCSSSDACIAVGSTGDSTSTSRTLAESWNGTSWVIQPTPN